MNSKAINAASMKNINKYMILKHIRTGNLSRSDLSRLTSLTRATITNIVDDLLREGYVIEYGFNKPKIGKRGIKLAINGDYAYAIGVAITRFFYLVNVIDLNCKSIEEIRVNSEQFESRYDAMAFISEQIQKFLDKYRNKIIGIGVASPGPIDSFKGTILNPPGMDEWHYFNVCQYLSDKFNLKCFIEKDINSYAIMEKTFGAGAALNTFLEIFADEGIGSALIINKELFSGMGQGCEFGHVSIDCFNGLPCPCGNIGCVEMYASIPKLLNAYAEKGLSYVSWRELTDSAYKDDNDALTIISAMARYLGSALISFLNIININTIVVTGELSYRPDILFEKIEAIIKKQIISKNTNIKIIPSKFNDIISQASGNIVFEKLFNGELNNN